MSTKSIIPRGSGEGGLGLNDVRWGEAYFDNGHFNSLEISGKRVLVEGDAQGGSSQDLSNFHEKNSDGGLTVTGQVNLSGHIIPLENAQFDLGSAEKKIRHLFLSDNSMFIGDQSISVDDNKNLLLPSGIKLGGVNGLSITQNQDGRIVFPEKGFVIGGGDGSDELIDGGYF